VAEFKVTHVASAEEKLVVVQKAQKAG